MFVHVSVIESVCVYVTFIFYLIINKIKYLTKRAAKKQTNKNNICSQISISNMEVLIEMKKRVSLVQKWFGLNAHRYYFPSPVGGLGVPNVAWINTSMQHSHLLNMLNNDDKDIKQRAQASLFLDLWRCTGRYHWPGGQNPSGFIPISTKTLD